jgi:hypothetical protein
VEIHSGLSVMVVSSISVGAGSVGVSKRPSLPATVSISGRGGHDLILPRHHALDFRETVFGINTGM